MGRSALAAAAAAADAAAVAAEKSRHAAEVADVIAKALGDTPNANVYALESAAASCDAAADRAAAAAAALLFDDESVAFGSIVTDTVASTGSSLMRSADRARRAGKSSKTPEQIEKEHLFGPDQEVPVFFKGGLQNARYHRRDARKQTALARSLSSAGRPDPDAEQAEAWEGTTVTETASLTAAEPPMLVASALGREKRAKAMNRVLIGRPIPSAGELGGPGPGAFPRSEEVRAAQTVRRRRSSRQPTPRRRRSSPTTPPCRP